MRSKWFRKFPVSEGLPTSTSIIYRDHESGQKVYGNQPVCHEFHVLGGLPEGLDDSGVADDHDDAGDQECDHQLIESEVDPDMEDDANANEKASRDYSI